MTTALHAATRNPRAQRRGNSAKHPFPALAWSTDTELRLTSVSGDGLGEWGDASVAMIGRNVCDLFRADGIEGSLAAMHQRALRGELVDAEQGHAGQIVRVRLEPLRNSREEIVGCIGIALDVTGWRRAETALEREATRLHALISNVPGAVYRSVADADWTIEYISDPIADITGYPPSDFVHNQVRTFVSIIHKDDWTRVEQELLASLSKRVPYDLEYRILCADGQVRWVQDRGRGIHDAQGVLRWVDGVVLDVTERKRAEFGLQEANRTLEARVAERGAALEARAHDLARTIEELERHTQIQQQILNSIEDGVVVVDMRGRFLAFTPLAEQILGPGAASVPIEKWVEVFGIYREDAVTPFPFNQLPLVRAMRGEECTRTVLFIRNPHAPEGIFLSVTARPWRDGQGRVCGGVAAVHNITEQHRARQALRETEARFSLLMDQVPSITWTTDCDLLITSSLGAGLKDVGLRPGQVVGMTLYDYCQTRDESHPIIAAHLKAVKGVRNSFETRHGELTFSTHVEPFYDTNRKIIGTIGFGLNITSRKRAEDALRESESKFRIMAETVAASTFIFQGACMRYVNPAAVEMTGYTDGELLQMDFWTIIHPDHREMVRLRGLARQRGEDVPPSYEVKIQRKDGAVRWVSFTAGVIDYHGERAVLGTAFDITELKRAEQALRDAETKNKAMLDAMPDLVFRVSRDGTYLDYKAANTEALLAPPDQIVGLNIKDLLPPIIAQRCLQAIRRAIETRTLQSVEYALEIRGERREFEARVIASGQEEVVALVRDTTDRKQLEREILDISDREQRRIGQDLHDGLCQHLTGTAFTAKILEQKLAERNLHECADAREIAELLEQAISQARRLARGLYPTEIEGEGIVPSLDHLATTLSDRFNIRCSFQKSGRLPDLERHQAFHLYRIAQEATYNAIRHGQARRIRIGLVAQRGRVRLSVRDDGVGFVPPTTKFQGMGLHIMKYRAEMLGGSFEIQRRKGRGTEVVCAFVCDQKPRRNGVSNGNEKATRKQSNQATGLRGR